VPEPLADALARLRTALLDSDTLARAVGSGRRRGQRPSWRRVELRYVDLKSGRHLQQTVYDDTQAHTTNAAAGPEAERMIDALLAEPFGAWHVSSVDATLQLRVTKRGDAQMSRSSPGAGVAATPDRAHDRTKRRLIDPAAPWLSAVGISDRFGTVKPTRQAKLRQVEEFCRLLASAVDDALAGGHLRTPTPDDPLRVVDLGCGNAYLTFAAHHWLTDVRGLPATVTGVDVRPAARDRNAALADRIGADGLRFVVSSIDGFPVDRPPDVVLALHACDTATDDALARALRWESPLVLAAPCCHHDLQTQLRGRAAPEPYAMLTRHGILRERLADTLTDALRASLVRMRGYRVDVVEFVASAHTPRNTLLRAVRTGAQPPAEIRREYDDLVGAWQVTPRLAELVGAVDPEKAG
jgi:SAM-dependent methyltransferase